LLPPFDVIFVWLPLVVVHVPYYTLVGRRNVSLFLQPVSQLELVLYICRALPVPLCQTLGQSGEQLDVYTHPAH